VLRKWKDISINDSGREYRNLVKKAEEELSNESTCDSTKNDGFKSAVLNLIICRNFEDIGTIYKGVLRNNFDLIWYRTMLLRPYIPDDPRLPSFCESVLSLQRKYQGQRVGFAFQMLCMALEFEDAIQLLRKSGQIHETSTVHMALVLYMCQLLSEQPKKSVNSDVKPLQMLMTYLQQHFVSSGKGAAVAMTYVSLLSLTYNDWARRNKDEEDGVLKKSLKKIASSLRLLLL